MGIFAFIIIGFVIGLVARVVLPSNQKLGLIATCVLGILGSVVGGGVLGSVVDGRPFELLPVDIILAVVVATLFLVLVGIANSRRAHA